YREITSERKRLSSSQYPNLAYFFKAYFHQNWKLIRDWKGKEPNFLQVVQEFKNGKSVEPVVHNTILELEKILALNLDETDLEELLYQIGSGSGIYAPSIGMTFQEW